MKGLRWTTAGSRTGRRSSGSSRACPRGSSSTSRASTRSSRGASAATGAAAHEDRERSHRAPVGHARGITLGSPLRLPHREPRPSIERLAVPTSPRPGHADLAGCQKFGMADPPAVLERASARETARAWRSARSRASCSTPSASRSSRTSSSSRACAPRGCVGGRRAPRARARARGERLPERSIPRADA